MKKPLEIPSGRMASLFIDMQEEHRLDERYLVEDYDEVLANARRLQEASRANRVPVYHCAYIVDLSKHARPFHPMQADGRSAFSDKDDPATAICPEVAPKGTEPVLIKAEASAFGATSPARALKEAGIDWLLISGVWTEACIDASVKDAIQNGFHVLLVKDACGSGSRAMHQAGIINLANRLYGGAVVTTDDACSLIRGGRVNAWQIEGSVPLRFTFANAADLYQSL